MTNLGFIQHRIALRLAGTVDVAGGTEVAVTWVDTAGGTLDVPTGAVVGQQPFGGGRASGTNDKAGSILNLYRWTSARTIKELGNPPTDWRYPYLG